ncbi:MAG: hypothetical protein CMH11_13195 [Maritimibacter sp.]|nr:hypothetical protein [Maritimibacter sp.]
MVTIDGVDAAAETDLASAIRASHASAVQVGIAARSTTGPPVPIPARRFRPFGFEGVRIRPPTCAGVAPERVDGFGILL